MEALFITSTCVDCGRDVTRLSVAVGVPRCVHCATFTRAAALCVRAPSTPPPATEAPFLTPTSGRRDAR